MQPTAGAKVGRFSLMRRIETDDDRLIWLGSHDAFGTMELAALDLPPGNGPDPIRAQNLRREAEVVQHLRHDGIQRVLEVGEIDGQVWIAREYVEGITLARLREPLEALRQTDDALRLACVAHIIGSIFEVLAHTHGVRTVPDLASGVTHGQLTAREILVSNRGVIKLAGFGVDRRPSDGTAGLMTHDALRSLAPELLAGVPLQPPADLYAVGILLHTLLDGSLPWPGLDAGKLYAAIMGGQPPALEHPVPSELAALHGALTVSSMSSRIADANTALARLRAWTSPRPDPAADLGTIVRGVLNPAPARDLFDQLSNTSSGVAAPVPVMSPAPMQPPAPAFPPTPAHAPSPQPAYQAAAPAPASPAISPSYRPAALDPMPAPVAAPPTFHPRAAPPMVATPPAPPEEGTAMIDPATLARMREAARQSSRASAPEPSPARPAPVAPSARLASPTPAPVHSPSPAPAAARPQPPARALPDLLPGLIRNSPAPAQPSAVPAPASGPRPPSMVSAAPRPAAPAPSTPAPAWPTPMLEHRRAPFEIPDVGEGTTTALLVRRERRTLAITIVAGATVAVTLGAVIAYLIIS